MAPRGPSGRPRRVPGSTRVPDLPAGTRFERGRGKYKYVAVVPAGGARKRERRVSFGHRDYQHYKDRVPRGLGGGLWAHKDHGDRGRRINYRTRHAGVLGRDGKPAYRKRYTPAWFSYYFLW